ncbi:hypothetical protein HII31_05759, partial [Pseudocercospora fuligena]
MSSRQSDDVKQASDGLKKHPKQARQPRTKPMKVLCLGMSRTGTLATYAALQHLGINSYHFAEAFSDMDNGALRKWRKAIEAKYFGNTKVKKLETADDFDEMLWRYEAVADIPCILFSTELLRAYPEAKVVLTTRDPDSWLRSATSIIYGILDLKIWKFLEWYDRNCANDYMKIIKYALEIWTGGDPRNHEALREGFLEHNEEIMRIVDKDRLLVFHPKDGWEPLCEHLGMKVPEGVEFPRINVGTIAVDAHAEWIWKERLWEATMDWVKVLAPFGGAFGAVVAMYVYWIAS